MYYQVEVTTKCNLACFYCAGRAMTQKHMQFDVYKKILDSAPSDLEYISLQGEGEPIISKSIWVMAKLAKYRSIPTYTITNAAYRLTETLAGKIDSHFDRIGISLDTINVNFAQRIGRVNLPRTLNTFESLVEKLGPQRIDVYTVALSRKSVDEVRRYVAGFPGVGHIIQPLQSKDDYQINYRIHKSNAGPEYRCRFMERDIMRFFNIDGIPMPCCYIKNTEKFQSIEHVESELSADKVPNCCVGCRELF
ncbi:MAG: radical SAM protein [Pseudomonadota bacterium]|nr:radical SAM protein [Pseudomonadota bacterium]